MKLVIPKSINKIEFDFLRRVFSLEIVKIAAKKALQGLGENIKNSSKAPDTYLKKLYLTSSGGAGRAIFLLKIGAEKAVLVMIRLKNDKQIGANMTVKNPEFKKVLEKNLDLILRDLRSGNYEEYDV
ncbi:MAG: hypothetical protein PHP74_02105 [Candidatus Gracilibacteria bacterium]|nr:hypothetical protein [Candidatus Gracilibacteria bacterium]